MENGSELNLPKEPPEEHEEKPLEEPKGKPPEGPEEKPTPPQEVRCPHCGSMIVPKVIKTPTGGERWTCPECTKLISKPKARPPGEKKESVYKGEEDPNEILRGILEKHPDLSSGHIEEIMDWAQFGPIPPYLVTQLLGGMKDVKRHTAELIGHKYQMALQMKMSQGGERPLFPPMTGMPQQGGYNMPWPTPQMQQSPTFGSPFQGHGLVNPIGGSSLSKEEVIEIIRTQERERELAEAKRKLDAYEKGEGTSNRGRGLTPEDLERILNEREKKRDEEKKEDALMQTLTNLNRGLENLNLRVSTMEQKPPEVPKKEEDTFNKQIRDAIARDISARITGAKGELTADGIARIVSAEVRKHTAPPPTGKRNEYDMQVEKATHEAEARKIEAEERRKGYEAIASGVRDGLQGLGWNIGAGVSGGSPKESSSTPAGTPAAEPQPIEWGDDNLWHTHCPFTDCGAPMAFEDGKSTVLCGSCGRVVRVQAPEEEIEKKGSRKTKEPEAEKPQVEKPEEEKPEAEKPQAEKPAEEKPEGGEQSGRS